PIGLDDPSDVCRRRGRHVLALLLALGATRLDAPASEAGRLDGAREATHGISPPGHTPFSALGPGRAAGSRGDRLGILLPPGAQCRLLDERRVPCADGFAGRP